MSQRPARSVVFPVACAAVLAGVTITFALATERPIPAGTLMLCGLLAIAYSVRSHKRNNRQLEREGKAPLPYLHYVFFPSVPATPQQEAPRATRILVGAIAVLVGAFFMYCSIGLAMNAEWERIHHPVVAVLLCAVPGAIGVVLLWTAWRLFAGRGTRDHVA